MPSSKSKEGSGSEPEKDIAYRNKVLELFNNYRARPDTPKYTYEEQDMLGGKMEQARKKFETGKDPEAAKELETLSAEFLESKRDKKHISTLWPPLMAAQVYLERAGEPKIPAEIKSALDDELQRLMKRMEEAREQKNMSDELVAESLDFMNKFENYIK